MINNITTLEHSAKKLRMAGHPERLRILLHLLKGEHSIQELSDLTNIEPNTIANHLQKMRQLHMVEYTRFYRILQYRIVSPTLKNILLHIAEELHQEAEEST